MALGLQGATLLAIFKTKHCANWENPIRLPARLSYPI
jgi:hypothetical protein